MVSDKGTMLADGHLFGNVQCIVVRDDNMIEAASDSRKMSKAAGY
jgi:gamma-glutamyltranspeptidase